MPQNNEVYSSSYVKHHLNLTNLALPGGSRDLCLNFKMSRVGVLLVLHVSVGRSLSEF